MLTASALSDKRGRKELHRRSLRRGWDRAEAGWKLGRARSLYRAQEQARQEYEDQREKQRAESRRAAAKARDRERQGRGFFGMAREALRRFMPRRVMGSEA